jgi:hypothetical protein
VRIVFWLTVYFFLGALLLSFMASLNYLGVVFIVTLGGLVGVWHRKIGNWSPPKSQPGAGWYSRSGTAVKIDEGDFHSGPEGYSPNTGYPETQYGSNFDDGADWNEAER